MQTNGQVIVLILTWVSWVLRKKSLLKPTLLSRSTLISDAIRHHRASRPITCDWSLSDNLYLASGVLSSPPPPRQPPSGLLSALDCLFFLVLRKRTDQCHELWNDSGAAEGSLSKQCHSRQTLICPPSPPPQIHHIHHPSLSISRVTTVRLLGPTTLTAGLQWYNP